MEIKWSLESRRWSALIRSLGKSWRGAVVMVVAVGKDRAKQAPPHTASPGVDSRAELSYTYSQGRPAARGADSRQTTLALGLELWDWYLHSQSRGMH